MEVVEVELVVVEVVEVGVVVVVVSEPVVWVSVWVSVTVVVFVTVFVSPSVVVEVMLSVGSVSLGWVSTEVDLLVLEGELGPVMQALMNTIPTSRNASSSFLLIPYPPVQVAEKSSP